MPDRAHQRVNEAMPMIACHGVVQGLPQPLNHLDPRVIDGLEEQFEPGVVRQPGLGDRTLVHDGVVHDERDAPCPTARSHWEDARGLFAGSDRGGERAAAMYTLIVTAKLNDIDPQAWLADVLARIADLRLTRVRELLHWNWKVTRNQTPAA